MLGLFCLVFCVVFGGLAIVDPQSRPAQGAKTSTNRSPLPREGAAAAAAGSGLLAALLGLKQGTALRRRPDGAVEVAEGWSGIAWQVRWTLAASPDLHVRLRITTQGWQVEVTPTKGRSAVLGMYGPPTAVRITRDAAVALGLPLRTTLPVPMPTPLTPPAATFDPHMRTLTWELSERDGPFPPPPLLLDPDSRLIVRRGDGGWELAWDGAEPGHQLVVLHRASEDAVKAAAMVLSGLMAVAAAEIT